MTDGSGGAAGGTCTFTRATRAQPGAIAVIQLLGSVEQVLSRLTAVDDWPVGKVRLVRFGDIDDGLVARVRNDLAQLMPHGGMRIMQRLAARLVELGAEPRPDQDVDPPDLYPESVDDIEALMLAALARARSGLAIDLLLEQPDRWRRLASSEAGQLQGSARAFPTDADLARSRRLNRLLDPPLVVLAGPPNVGKSTLSNVLLGRAMSIEMDEPGTTRDYTTALVDLAGLAVRWHDTPGFRATDDPIERRAIELSQRLVATADLIVAITDHEHDWPELPRPADLKVASKSDVRARDDADLAVSARSAAGLGRLVRTIRDRLVPGADLADPRPWIFDDRLLRAHAPGA